MGKMKKSRFAGDEERSLYAMYKELIAKFEENGIDVNEQFQKIGGKDRLLQYIQDLEDNVINDSVEVFKNAYRDGDIRRCVLAIVNMLKKDWFLYKRGIRTVLYTKGNLLRNPLHYSFGQDDYEKTQNILLNTIRYIEHLSKQKESPISKEMVEICNRELMQMYLLYECMYHNKIQNKKVLSKLKFLKNSLPQIIKCFLVFFQSQYNLAREEMANRWDNQDYITGVESLVSSEPTSLNSDIHVSMGDSFEQLLEDMDALFRYVYYLKNDEKEIPENELLSMEFLTPYESPEVQMLATLAMFDSLFIKLEASFRFYGWNIMSEKDIYYFYPSDDKSHKIHIAAGFRNKYKYMTGIFDKVMESTIGNQLSPCYYTENAKPATEDSIKKECLPRVFYQEYLSVSQRMDLGDVEGFHFDVDEYTELVTYVQPIIESTRSRNKSFYFSCRFNDMNVDEYLDAYVFLYIFSKIYYCKAFSKGTQKELVAMVSLKYLYKEFSKISKYDYDMAKKLIDCYVFDKKIAKQKKFGDIFTRPIISVGSGMVLISEGLINQINIDRNIEVLLDWNNVNLAPMGKALERRLTYKLKNSKFIFVNTNKVDFLAYDGRMVEFDFIAVIDDYLLLIEMKSLLQPYDADELYRRKKTLSEGIAQIKRRVNIVRNDWDKIKGLVDISLPDIPYDEKHIIKVVCTDVYNYTGLEEQDVIITDEATVLKYFTNPYVTGILNKQDEGVKFINKRILWKNGRPTAEEFISYLRCPATMEFIMKCIEQEWKPIPLWDKYKKIAFLDMEIKKDPIRYLSEMYCQL